MSSGSGAEAVEKATLAVDWCRGGRGGGATSRVVSSRAAPRGSGDGVDHRPAGQIDPPPPPLVLTPRRRWPVNSGAGAHRGPAWASELRHRHRGRRKAKATPYPSMLWPFPYLLTSPPSTVVLDSIITFTRSSASPLPLPRFLVASPLPLSRFLVVARSRCWWRRSS